MPDETRPLQRQNGRGKQQYSPNAFQAELVALKESMANLESKVDDLRALCRVVVLLTAVNPLFLMPVWQGVMGYMPVRDPRTEFNAEMAFLYISMFFVFSAMYVLFSFEQVRREGNALFQAISDKMEGMSLRLRRDGSTISMDAKAEYEALDAQARQAIRAYVRHADLPLVGGTAGTAAYAVFNAALMILALAAPLVRALVH